MGEDERREGGYRSFQGFQAEQTTGSRSTRNQSFSCYRCLASAGNEARKTGGKADRQLSRLDFCARLHIAQGFPYEYVPEILNPGYFQHSLLGERANKRRHQSLFHKLLHLATG
jgi:hypothetical protein